VTFVAVVLVMSTVALGTMLIGASAATALHGGPVVGRTGIVRPHFTTTNPIYTPGEMYGGSNAASLCYTCEAADVTGTAPPSESLDEGTGVDSLTGDFSTTNTLFKASSEVDFSLSLTYDAQLAQAEVTAGPNIAGPFGVGWSSNFDASITPQSGLPSNSITVNQANGAQAVFTQSGGGGQYLNCPTGDQPNTYSYTAPWDNMPSPYQWCALSSVQGQFTDVDGLEFLFQTNGGENQEYFNWNGSLAVTTNDIPYGGVTSVTYNNAPEVYPNPYGFPPCPTGAYACTDIAEIEDGSSTTRFIIEVVNSSGQVVQAIDPSGVTYNFTHDSKSNLTSVTSYANQTNSSTWNYVYDTAQASPNSSDLIEIYDPDSGVGSSPPFSSGAPHSNVVNYYNSSADSGMVSSIVDGTGAATSYAYSNP
jgi:YD repeat-containing protein